MCGGMLCAVSLMWLIAFLKMWKYGGVYLYEPNRYILGLELVVSSLMVVLGVVLMINWILNRG